MKFGQMYDKMMRSKPVVTSMAVLLGTAIIIILMGYFIVKFPTLTLTVIGVAATWIIVLFLTKLSKIVR